MARLPARDPLDADLEDLARLVAEQPEGLTRESTARLVARLAGGDAGALFLIRELGIVDETRHQETAGLEAGLERLAEMARDRIARGDATGPPLIEQLGGGPLLAVAPLVCRECLRGLVGIAWSAERAASPSVLARLEGIARLLAARIEAEDRREADARLRDQHNRWVETTDRQIRLLDRERQKFAAVVNQSDTFAFVTDASRTIRWANPALGARFSPSRDFEWLGKSCRDLCSSLGESPAGAGCLRCPIERTLETNEPGHQEFRERRDGAIRTLYVTTLPIRGPEGRPTEVLALLQDLTDLEVLRRSESRYRLLFDRSAIAIAMVDPETLHIRLANHTLLQMLGYTLDQLLQRPVQSLHAPDEWSRIQPRYALAIAGAPMEGFECRLRERGGNLRVATVNARPFDLDHSRVLLLEFLDITDRKRTEQALLESQEQLAHSERLDAVGRLAGGVAHDFNNLLSVILGRSELLLDRMPPGDVLRADVEQIHAASERGAWLIRQLLAFGRVGLAAPEILGLRQVVEEMLEMLRGLLGSSIELSVSGGGEDACIRMDRAQVEQVLLNLVLNARDALPDGGRVAIEVANVPRQPSTAVEARGATDHDVSLTVRDDGIGMDEATRARIFEPYFTTKDVGNGPGLGLSIVYGIVVQSGGDVVVTSEPGRGTAVRIVLPSAETAPPSGPASPAGTPAATETLLLVEDDDAVRDVAREVLEMEGYRVLEARGGAQALQISEHHNGPIDLLVTDIVMPHMGGGELARRLTRQREGLRVLYVSGFTNDAIIRRGLLQADTPFLQKPFTLDALAAKVRETLEAPPRTPASETLPPEH